MANKLINCKTCGAEMAKSAKVCPKCGAKNKKPIYKRKGFYFLIVLLVIIVAIVIGKSVLNNHYKANIGDTFTASGVTYTINNIELGKTHYYNNEYYSSLGNDFMKPLTQEEVDEILSKKPLSGNDYGITSVGDKSDCIITVTMTLTNSDTTDITIEPNDYQINYDNGYTYQTDNAYYKGEHKWEEFKELQLEKLTSPTVEIKFAVAVPKEVKESDKSLELKIPDGPYEYKVKIR